MSFGPPASSPGLLDGRSRSTTDRAARVRFRRAMALMVMTLVLPGSAQLVYGNRRVGLVALRIWVVLVAGTLFSVVLGALWHGFAFWFVSDLLVLGLLRAALMLLAVGWAVLFMDAWRIGQPLTLAQKHRRYVVGVNGLLSLSVAGTLLFGFIALTVVSFALGRFHLATFGGVVVGALLAFLWFNIYPARFFMGDTGAMSLGITMGVIAMLTNTTLFLPLFVPILVIESLSVIIQMVSKKVRGKKVFLSAPLHHHFEAIGWPETKITMRFWIISAMSSAFGLALFFLHRYLLLLHSG